MTARAVPTIIQTANDPFIWKDQFRDRKTWANWFTLVKSLFAIPLDNAELQLFKECTGRDAPSGVQAKEGWLIVGRRGGKSRILAFIAAYLAAFPDWSPYLDPGEVGVISVIASDRKQCRAIMSYLKAFLSDHPHLGSRVKKKRGDSDEEIKLSNGLVIEVATCSFRAVRGRTTIACLCDEAAFWASEDGSNPASEVIKAIRPSMATVKRSMLLVASSPYSRRGPLFEAFQRYWGSNNKNILVWKAPTWVMNPALPRSSDVIKEEYEKDPVSAEAEFGAEWRNDIAAFVDPEAIAKVTIKDRIELPPEPHNYVAFCDAAGGSGGDSWTASVVHLSPQKKVIVDAVREIVPPFSPEAAIAECVRLFKPYRITKVTGDRWGGLFPAEGFAKFGINYVPSEMTKSEIYQEMLALINSGRVELLDYPKLIRQLCGLERRVARGGKDSIDHPLGQHDDLANAVCGAAVLCNLHPPFIVTQEMLAASRMPPNRNIMSLRQTNPICFFGTKSTN